MKNEQFINLETLASLSCYKELTSLDKKNKVFLVENSTDQKIYVKKITDIYCYNVYLSLMENHIEGTPRIYELIKTAKGKLIIIEEYVNGTLLSDIISKKHLSEERVCEIFTKICKIVKKIHALNPPIIHKDIKASNIIMTSKSDPVLIDFDIAKLEISKDLKRDISVKPVIKETDTYLLGSQGYAAPEQYGFGKSTKKTDIYALGILLNTMLKQGEVSKTPADNSRLRPIIEKCISLNPDDRYKDIDTLIHALDNYKTCTVDVFRFPSIKNIPGFRSGTPWHMAVSFFYYVLAFAIIISFALDESKKDYALFDVICELIILISLFFISILFIFNYRNIWKFIPFAKSDNKIIKIISIILSYILLSFILIFLYVTFGEIFSFFL